MIANQPIHRGRAFRLQDRPSVERDDHAEDDQAARVVDDVGEAGQRVGRDRERVLRGAAPLDVARHELIRHRDRSRCETVIIVIPTTERSARGSAPRRVAGARSPRGRRVTEQPAGDHEPRASPMNAAFAPFTSSIQSIALCPVSGISPSTPLQIISATPPKKSAASTPQTPAAVVRVDRFNAGASYGRRFPLLIRDRRGIARSERRGARVLRLPGAACGDDEPRREALQQLEHRTIRVPPWTSRSAIPGSSRIASTRRVFALPSASADMRSVEQADLFQREFAHDVARTAPELRGFGA